MDLVQLNYLTRRHKVFILPTLRVGLKEEDLIDISEEVKELLSFYANSFSTIEAMEKKVEAKKQKINQMRKRTRSGKKETKPGKKPR